MSAESGDGLKRAVLDARPAVLVAVLFSLWAFAIAIGESVPVNEGLGWDGVRFAGMAAAGPSTLVRKEINSYYVQRVGPSFAARGFLLAVNAEFTAANIRAAFVVLNAIVLTASLILLLDAARRLGVGALGRWILFLGLFANMANGRLPVYYAPLGDSTAFFIGSVAAWAYVARRSAALIAAFLVAIVSWPAAFALLPLLVWPRREGDAEASVVSETANQKHPGPGVLVLALPLGALLLAALWILVAMPAPSFIRDGVLIALVANSFQLGLAALVAALVVVSSRGLLQRPNVAGVIAAIALVAASFLYVRAFESGSLAFSGKTYAREIILFATDRPFAALAGHASYYGALAIAAAMLWPRVLRAGLSIGTGAFVTLAISGLLAIDAESRRLNANWPLAGLFACVVLDRLVAHRRDVAIFAALAIALSKLWWPLAGPPLFPAAHDPGNYFNTQGPSLSTEAFIAHLLFAALVAAWAGALRLTSAGERDAAADHRDRTALV